MAASPNPLVWDFNREIGRCAGVKTGGIIHYYDEEAQTIFLNGGIKNRRSNPTEGHWETSDLSSPSSFISHDQYSELSLDHPSNGTVFGSATDGSKLYMLRYVYAMDMSNILMSWDWDCQTDNPISQFSASVLNVGSDVFMDDSTLFQPGAKIKMDFKMGHGQAMPMGVAWLDEISYDVTAESVNLTGRNTIGYFLKDQTFDDWWNFTGTSDTIVNNILMYAGIDKRRVQVGTGTHPFVFKPSDSLLDGLNQIMSYYSTSGNPYTMIELAHGYICVGYESWLKSYQPKGYYTFDEGRDVFKRKTTKMVDSAYTHIRVTGKTKDAEDKDVDLTPVTLPVPNFDNWALGVHRTLHLTAPDGMTQAKLQSWAQAQADMYKYIGIAQDFTGPFRPQLNAGDVALINANGGSVCLGIITEVRHRFAKRTGFQTEFTVDSGGVVTSGDNYELYTRSAATDGYNRKQRVIDLVRYVANK